mmetsp:Transcript_27651/g.32729  ORF Transcript_27651/g.32729 Transcript_27651/m.32729 type:complete len:86 (-) Transcript_27651:108-365(-)
MDGSSRLCFCLGLEIYFVVMRVVYIYPTIRVRHDLSTVYLLIVYPHGEEEKPLHPTDLSATTTATSTSIQDFGYALCLSYRFYAT